MSQNILKYKGINFPLFALKQAPYQLEFTLDKIYTKLSINSHKQLVDDKNLQGNYFERLLQMDKRIDYDFTCTSLQDLVYCKAKWGIDVNGIPHDFSSKYQAKVEQRRVERIRDNLIWLRNISYPFRLNTKEKVELNDTLYATIVYINYEWFILDFSLDIIKLPQTIRV